MTFLAALYKKSKGPLAGLGKALLVCFYTLVDFVGTVVLPTLIFYWSMRAAGAPVSPTCSILVVFGYALVRTLSEMIRLRVMGSAGR